MKKVILSMRWGLLLLPLLLLASCAVEEFESESNVFKNKIGFSAIDDGAAVTKSEIDYEPIGNYLATNKSGTDSLYFNGFMSDVISMNGESISTKAIPINSTNFYMTVQRFYVNAFRGTSKYINNETCTLDDATNFYLPSKSYYWPESDALTFWAHANLPTGNITNLAHDPANSQMTFTYAMPEPGDPAAANHGDAKNQKDILFGYFNAAQGKNTAAVTSNSGAVPMVFNHALAAIKFAVGETTGGTVKSISIKNISSSGNCTYNGSQFGFYWSGLNTANKTYIQDFGITVEPSSSPVVNQPLTDVSPVRTFMVIPQTLTSAAEFEIVFNNGTSDQILTAAIPSGKWEAGKSYTYVISMNLSSWVVIVEDIPDITVNYEGSTTESFNVKSYRKDLLSGDTEPSAWTLQYWNGSAWVNTKPSSMSWMSTASASGTGGTTAQNVGTTINPQTHSTDPTHVDNVIPIHNANLKAHPVKTNFDLSYWNPAMNHVSTVQNTANCYVVNGPGTYKFPIVYGNGIKNGSTNYDTMHDGSNYLNYQGDPTGATTPYPKATFVNHADYPITTPYIKDNLYGNGSVKIGAAGNTMDAVVLWQDAPSLVTNVSVNPDKTYVNFECEYNNITQGNAIIAVRMNGTVVWSWHIWVTDEDLSKVSLTKVDASQPDYYIMPYNLGWCSIGAGQAYHYDGRQAILRIISEGVSKSFNVYQLEFDAYPVSSNGNCPFYQWGRKDPMLPGNGFDNVDKYYQTPASSSYAPSFGQHGPVTIGESIRNPWKTYDSATGGEYPETSTDDWCKGHYWHYGYGGTGTFQYYNNGFANLWSANATKISTLYEDMTNNALFVVKTVYDPSPVGYKVPNAEAYMLMEGVATYNNEMHGAEYKNFNNEIIFLPACGYRGWAQYGGLIQVWQDSNVWTATSVSRHKAHYGYVNPQNDYQVEWDMSVFYKSVGGTIRPIVDTETMQAGVTGVTTWGNGGNTDKTFN